MKFNRANMTPILATALMLTLAGCSRTVNDIEKWKLAGKDQKLIKALSDPKAPVRQAAAEALGELKSTAAPVPLARLFTDEETKIRGISVDSLIQIATIEAQDQLVVAINTLTNPTFRVTAVTGLGTLNAKQAIPVLTHLLDNTEPTDMRCAAATALGLVGHEAVSTALTASLGASSAELRLAVAQALGKTKGPAAVTGLTEALGDANKKVEKAIVQSLIAIGTPAIPETIQQLRASKTAVRRSAIEVLDELSAAPTEGPDFIWYILARESVNNRTKLNMAVVQKLAPLKQSAINTLLEAAAHVDPDIRMHAARTLEQIGKIAVEPAILALHTNAKPEAITWFEQRQSWEGAPAWKIDLWAAVAGLNPDFKIDTETITKIQAKARSAFTTIVAPDFKVTPAYIPALIQLLGDDTIPPPPGPAVDADGMPIVQKKVDSFRGEANQRMASDKLIKAGHITVLPLITALNSSSSLIQNNAAAILNKFADRRAIRPLTKVVEKKLNAGEELTDTALYTALVRFNDPIPEPLLLRIRPNTDRAMQIYERKYNVKVNLCENSPTLKPEESVFRIGFIRKGRVVNAMVTFAQNSDGHWVPTPPLPDEIAE